MKYTEVTMLDAKTLPLLLIGWILGGILIAMVQFKKRSLPATRQMGVTTVATPAIRLKHAPMRAFY